MPTAQKYVARSGAVTYRVRFRDAGASASETFHTKKQANDFIKLVNAMGGTKARAIINEAEAGDVILTKLGEVADKWWAYKSATRSDGTPLRVDAPYTLTRYEQIIRLHIKPHLGDKPINLVSESDIQDWVDLLADDLAAKTVKDAHSLLHGIYKWANKRSQGLAVTDPCTDTELPKKRKNLAKGLKPNEWTILYAAAERVSKDAADLLLFLVASGWRWSEAVALRSVDVDDYGDGRVFVSVGRVLRRNGNSFEFVDDSAKSQAGIRRVKLGRSASAMVRRRRAGLAPDDLLFTNDQGRKWSYSGFHSRYWTANRLKHEKDGRRPRILMVAQEMGLSRAPDVSLHFLRHTHAALMLETGAPMANVQKRLGHEDIQTTVGTYGSMVGDVSDDSLDALDEILTGQSYITGASVPVAPHEAPRLDP